MARYRLSMGVERNTLLDREASSDAVEYGKAPEANPER
jgi:hypothetical protein